MSSTRPDQDAEGRIDWPRVWELRDEIGGSEFSEVVDLFLSETEALVDGLTSAAPTALESDLHALKGAALNLGFTELAALCAEGEWLAAQGRGEDVSLVPIMVSFDGSRRAFIDGLRVDAS